MRHVALFPLIKDIAPHEYTRSWDEGVTDSSYPTPSRPATHSTESRRSIAPAAVPRPRQRFGADRMVDDYLGVDTTLLS
jgi:hypothetical protein